MIQPKVLLAISIVTLMFSVACSTKNHEVERPIQAFCIDFNWGDGGPNAFAAPGLWADASPKEHIQWYKDLGVNTIQTFTVSCNGYAWYKNGIVPEQPGLKNDFLPEMVRLGHKEGMKVMGYFCIGSNTRWGIENPEFSYGYSHECHIPYTKTYLKYLDEAIRDAVSKTGIDGFMIDWLWQPERTTTNGKWLESEKQLYEELMGEAFPGENELSESKYNEYSRMAINNCWKTIYTAAKQTNPDCIIWLSCHSTTHPHVVNSEMFRQVDWLMNEGGDMERVDAIKNQVGSQTKLLTCLAQWNKQDALEIVPKAVKNNIGLYGFTKPGENTLLPPINNYLSVPVDSLHGDEKNIAAFARIFNGFSMSYVEN